MDQVFVSLQVYTIIDELEEGKLNQLACIINTRNMYKLQRQVFPTEITEAEQPVTSFRK